MIKLKSLILKYIKLIIPILVRFFGFEILNKFESKAGLNSFIIYSSLNNVFEFNNLAKDNSSIITLIGESPASHIYKIEKFKFHLLSYGGLRINNKIFDLDFGNSLFVKYILPKRKKILKVENCIFLWSHEWGTGYYDFMFFVLMKLNRIVSCIKELSSKDTVICLPFKASELPYFAFEYFSLFGFSNLQIIDSREVQVVAKKYFFGDNNSFFFPNFYDVKIFKNNLNDKFNSLIKSVTNQENLIYLKRSGKRKVSNEAELIPILEKFNFTILEDTPRSIFDQFKLFQSAKIIIGPHGAGFSNILFCKTNTKIIEFFPKNYYPPHYFYLSGVLGLDYYGFIENEGSISSHYANTGVDLYIKPFILENLLIKLC